MQDFLPLLREYVRRLSANPAIQVEAKHFRNKPNIYLPKDERPLEVIKQSFEQQYDFEVTEVDAQLLQLPYRFSIAWSVQEMVPEADWLRGEIAILNPAISLRSPSQYQVPIPADIEDEWARNAYWFDRWVTHGIYDPCTVLIYDAADPYYTGLAYFAEKGDRVMLLDLGWSEYLHAALTWHGVARWQLLYLELDYFLAIPTRYRASVARLRRLLPRLFPDADWSIIAAKQAYFDAADEAERELAGARE